MTTNLNVLPTRTDASLGQTKVDPGWAVSRIYSLLLGEYNAAADWIIELASLVGLRAGGAWDSLRGIYGGDTLDWHEHWLEPAVASMPRWATTIVAPTPLGGLRGGLSYPLDSGAGIDFQTAGTNYARAQTPLVRAHYTLSGNPGVCFTVRFQDGAGNEGWGIKLTTAGTKIQGFIRTGGVDTPVDVGSWVAGIEVIVSFYLVANILYVSVNGGTAVACGTAPVGDMRLRFWADVGGVAAQTCIVRNGLIRANWTT